MEEKTKLTPEQHENFKMLCAFALNGILGSLPFGVGVDPSAIAQAAKNTALAMIEAQKDIEKE